MTRLCVGASFLAQKIVSTLLAALGLVALVLSAMGIYGVMAYVVSQRTHELGIRLALGAPAGRLIQLVLSQGMKLTALGLLIGLVGAVALSHSLTSFLYGLSPFDPSDVCRGRGDAGGGQPGRLPDARLARRERGPDDRPPFGVTRR